MCGGELHIITISRGYMCAMRTGKSVLQAVLFTGTYTHTLSATSASRFFASLSAASSASRSSRRASAAASNARRSSASAPSAVAASESDDSDAASSDAHRRSVSSVHNGVGRYGCSGKDLGFRLKPLKGQQHTQVSERGNSRLQSEVCFGGGAIHRKLGGKEKSWPKVLLGNKTNAGADDANKICCFM